MGTIKDAADLTIALISHVKDRKIREALLPIREKILEAKEELIDLKEAHYKEMSDLKEAHAKEVAGLKKESVRLEAEILKMKEEKNQNKGMKTLSLTRS